jgi:hypothetical protein
MARPTKMPTGTNRRVSLLVDGKDEPVYLTYEEFCQQAINNTDELFQQISD